jgi:hypothetical protein
MTEEHGKENLWLWMKFSVLRTGTAVWLTLERSGRICLAVEIDPGSTGQMYQR